MVLTGEGSERNDDRCRRGGINISLGACHFEMVMVDVLCICCILM